MRAMFPTLLICATMLPLAACGGKAPVAAAPTPIVQADASADSAAAARREEERIRAEEQRRAAEELQRRADAQRRADDLARVRTTLEELVFFDYNRSDLRPDIRAALDAKAALLRATETLRLDIGGHADERGSDEYNLALAMRRAATVKQYLVSYGIAGSRLDARSYGEERPLDPGHTEGAWARNRRADFQVIGLPSASRRAPGTDVVRGQP